MEVTITPQTLDSNFNAKPLVGNYYFSAPASPDDNLHRFYRLDFDDRSSGWPSPAEGNDFAFDVSREWETTASFQSAEELFDGGVIKPLSPLPPPPPPPEVKRVFQPGTKIQGDGASNPDEAASRTRRGRNPAGAPVKSRAARSLSPPHRDDAEFQHPNNKGQKKWRLKDFFLFRSASEGRAAEKDVLKKYGCTTTVRRAIEGSGSGLMRNGAGRLSAHEIHYMVNRAISEDLKKKTFLPYKQGIVGRLAFNPAVHALSNGFGFSRRAPV